MLAVPAEAGKRKKRCAAEERVEATRDNAFDDGSEGPYLVRVVSDQDDGPERDGPEGRAEQRHPADRWSGWHAWQEEIYGVTRSGRPLWSEADLPTVAEDRPRLAEG